MTPADAYTQVCELAREHALIYQDAGGIVMIVHPDTQKAEGIYEHVQYVHRKGPHPGDDEKPLNPLCEWKADEDGTYWTGCEQAFVFNDDGPKENGMKFCCYCGKPLTTGPNVEVRGASPLAGEASRSTAELGGEG